MIDFLRTNKTTTWICLAFWICFAASFMAKDAFFSNSTYPIIPALLHYSYLFLPWLLFSLICGWLVARTMGTDNRKIELLVHSVAAATILLLHTLVLASSWWIFFPLAVKNVTLSD
ncbi:MAG: hypothetical protein ACI9H8_001139 [Lysobacterales bacterium]|jgi:hypothetical protein